MTLWGGKEPISQSDKLRLDRTRLGWTFENKKRGRQGPRPPLLKGDKGSWEACYSLRAKIGDDEGYEKGANGLENRRRCVWSRLQKKERKDREEKAEQLDIWAGLCSGGGWGLHAVLLIGGEELL